MFIVLESEENNLSVTEEENMVLNVKSRTSNELYVHLLVYCYVINGRVLDVFFSSLLLSFILFFCVFSFLVIILLCLFFFMFVTNFVFFFILGFLFYDGYLSVLLVNNVVLFISRLNIEEVKDSSLLFGVIVVNLLKIVLGNSH